MKRTVSAIIIIIPISLFTGWFYSSHRSNDSNINPQLHSVKKSSPNSILKSEFNKSKYSLSDPSSIWIVVNKSRPLYPAYYAPKDLILVGNSQTMRRAAAAALTKLFNAAAEKGLRLSALSGYRSYATQVSVYGNEVKNYGQQIADSESARPGYSEHQTGWAVDLGGGGCGIEACFGNTPEGKWVAANAYKYGFIVRYTAAKQAITGYRAEPWHIRYIGTELSIEMHKTGISTLEEFFGL